MTGQYLDSYVGCVQSQPVSFNALSLTGRVTYEVKGNSLISFSHHWHLGHASQEGISTLVRGTDSSPEVTLTLSLVTLYVSQVEQADMVRQGGLLHHDPLAGYSHSLPLGTDVTCQCS